MRIRGTSTKELSEAGEDTEGLVTNKSKLRTKVKAITGIDILADSGNFKSTYQILTEIANVWKDISDTEQAALLEVLAGKTRGSVVAALLQQPDVLKNAYEDAQNAAGSAMEENEKYLNSIQGRIDLFNNAVQTMWNNALDDSVIKWFVNLGTELVKIVDNFGLIKTLIVAIGTYIIKKNFGGILFGTQNNDALKKAKQNLANAKKTLTEYTGNDPKKLYKYRDSVNRAQKSLDLLIKKQGQAKKSAAEMWGSIKVGAKKALVVAKQFIQSMLIMTAITTAAEFIGKGFKLIGNVFSGASKDAEKANEEFENFKSQLSECESELKSLESELKSNQDAIDELMSQGTLTYVEQEELERLRSVTSELENQIRLKETLKESLQKSTNSASVTAAQMYLDNTSFGSEKSKTERQAEAEENGKSWGSLLGLIGGALISLIPGVNIAAGVLAGAGVLLGGMIGGAAGSAIAGSNYDQEQNVQNAIKNMQEQRQALVDTQNEALADKNTEAYNNATEALGNYDKQMATHISQMSEYYNSIDWATATDEEKKYARYLGDLLDTYNISMGTAESKSSAISRIFGVEATDGLKKVKKAWEENTNSTKDFSTVLEETLSVEEYDTFISRLHDMGLYVVDLENYFKEVKAAEEDALPNDLTSVADDVNKVTDALETLKSAFDEINEKGYLTVKTFESLKEKFADNSDALAKYANVVLSGVSSTEEIIEATEELAKSYIDSKLLNGEEVTALERIEYIVQLKELGVTNAEEYVDDKIRENAYKAIKNSATYNYDEVKEAWLKEDSTRTDEDYETALADGTIDAWAKAHNYFKDISKEEAQEIADRYGIEIDNIDDVISKLEELANAEAELKQAQDAKDEYDTWAENYKKKKEELDALKKEVNDFNPDDWTEEWRQGPGGSGYSTGYYTNGDRRLTTEEYEKLKSKYEKLKQLQEDFEKLKQEGQKKTTNGVAWVDENGELSDAVSKEFADAYNAAKEGKEKLEGEIETELTAEVKLELELQDKSKLVDDIQSTFDTLASAAKEVQENGYFSVDSLQGLLELEPKYLALLYDENGNLNLNKDALYEVAKARLTDLGIQAQQNILENAKRIATEGSISSMRKLIDATYDAAEANEIFIQTELASIRAILDKRAADKEDELYGNTTFVDSYMQGVQNQLNAVAGSIQIAKDNIQNTLSSSGNTAKQDAIDAFQKAMTYWENRIAANQARYEQVQNEIDILEKQGKRAGAEYYQEQIKLEKERLSLLEQQKAEAQKFLGTFKEGSDDWWNAAEKLNSLEGEIDDVTASIQDLNDAIAAIGLYIFEQSHERFQSLIDDLETIRDLIAANGEEDWFDDEGMWTEKGTAVLGTYIQQYEMYKNLLAGVNEELAKYQKEYKGNEAYYKNLGIDSEQEYYWSLYFIHINIQYVLCGNT